MMMLSLDPNLTKPHISKLQVGDKTGELTDVVFRIIGFHKSLQKLPQSVLFHTERAGYWVQFSTSNNSTVSIRSLVTVSPLRKASCNSRNSQTQPHQFSGKYFFSDEKNLVLQLLFMEADTDSERKKGINNLKFRLLGKISLLALLKPLEISFCTVLPSITWEVLRNTTGIETDV